ncbi:MAG: hypothetical protein ACI93N_000626, partial [Flavobacteriaceae bacterium]
MSPPVTFNRYAPAERFVSKVARCPLKLWDKHTYIGSFSIGITTHI